MLTVLTNCNVVDVTGTGDLQSAAVAVDNGKIAAVGPAGEIERSFPDADTIDLRGMYLMPGLWDMHAHPGWIWEAMQERRYRAYEDADVAMTFAGRAQDFLSCGVTSIRVVGDAHGVDIAMRNAIAAGRIQGPTLFCAGNALTPTGGHGSNSFQNALADGEDGFRAEARRQIQAGADLIKVMVTGGSVGGPTREELAAAVATAHKANKKVAVHIRGSEDCLMAAEVGVDSVEHGYDLNEDAVSTMKREGILFVPTLLVSDSEKFWHGMGVPGWLTGKIAKLMDGRPPHHACGKLAIEARLTMAVGSDVPSSRFDGYCVTVREMEILQELGMAPADVLTAATVNAAAWCGVSDSVGTIEAGKDADLIATVGNPKDDVSCLRSVTMVMKRGSVIRFCG